MILCLTLSLIFAQRNVSTDENFTPSFCNHSISFKVIVTLLVWSLIIKMDHWISLSLIKGWPCFDCVSFVQFMVLNDLIMEIWSIRNIQWLANGLISIEVSLDPHSLGLPTRVLLLIHHVHWARRASPIHSFPFLLGQHLLCLVHVEILDWTSIWNYIETILLITLVFMMRDIRILLLHRWLVIGRRFFGWILIGKCPLEAIITICFLFLRWLHFDLVRHLK